jgi:putative nucleotidyltransferase-like protein
VNPSSPDLLAGMLVEPARLLQLEPREWDLLVRQSRSADLLARIAALLQRRALLDRVPAGPRAALISATVLATAQQAEVRREVAHVSRALQSLAVQLVVLKGAAYLLAGLPAALGRTFADVDVLVPRDRLAEVEAALMLAGWATTHHSEYDQRYYRTWMHELPPLQHIRRQTVLDVHHAILPATARLKPESSRLLAAAQTVEGVPGVQVLAPADMVLHSMTHLFHNDDLSHGLRDLSDLDLLLRHFSATIPGFWEQLLDRSTELDLRRPVYYGLHQTHRVLRTPVPAASLQAARRFAAPWPVRNAMNWLWSRALRAQHPSTSGPLTALSLSALYIRAHWLRMPPALLARHLLIKSAARWR